MRIHRWQVIMIATRLVDSTIFNRLAAPSNFVALMTARRKKLHQRQDRHGVFYEFAGIVSAIMIIAAELLAK